jgi:deazaflavin-dependent oxidoreductase (nitroreductase family)
VAIQTGQANERETTLFPRDVDRLRHNRSRMADNPIPPMSERPPNFDDDLVAQFRANAGRLTSGPFAGRTVLLLTTTGARSGRRLTKPLGFTRDGERYVVIASKGGSPTNPAWFHNLRANPRVRIEVGAEQFDALASVPEGAERERPYEQQAAQFPMFARYKEMTMRQIPVVVFDRL